MRSLPFCAHGSHRGAPHPACVSRDKASASSAQQNAHRLSENEGVKARIAELKDRNAEKCAMARAEAVQYLVEILKTSIGEVTADHRLAQSYDAKSGKIELPNKLGALQLLAKMCGWNEPEKHEFEHGFKAQQDLVEVIARLRGRGAVRNNQGVE